MYNQADRVITSGWIRYTTKNALPNERHFNLVFYGLTSNLLSEFLCECVFVWFFLPKRPILSIYSLATLLTNYSNQVAALKYSWCHNVVNEKYLRTLVACQYAAEIESLAKISMSMQQNRLKRCNVFAIKVEEQKWTYTQTNQLAIESIKRAFA